MVEAWVKVMIWRCTPLARAFEVTRAVKSYLMMDIFSIIIIMFEFTIMCSEMRERERESEVMQVHAVLFHNHTLYVNPHQHLTLTGPSQLP
jgi:hypothetical protein